MVRISEIQPFPGFLKLFREISVPFAAVSKVSKVLVELKAPIWCTRGAQYSQTSVEEFAIIGNPLAAGYFSAYVII